MHVMKEPSLSTFSDKEWAAFARDVKAALRSTHRSVLIRRFDDPESNGHLVRLANLLGTPHAQPGFPHHPSEGLIFRVESRGDGIKDSRGIVLYSTTHLPFSSHTDGC